MPTITTSSSVDGKQSARLEIAPGPVGRGHVDGAWWPRSRESRTEFPALIATLDVRGSRVGRLRYHVDSWPMSGRRLSFGIRSVRLQGFDAIHPDTVDVTVWNGPTMTLLVIPPSTASAAAERILATVADGVILATPAELLGRVGSSR
jgi:hypothetical protein